MKKIILFAFLLFSGLLFSQTTYYVSTTGSNSASGTSSNPFLTIQYAIDASVNGDSVIVLPGVYSGGIIYNGKNITISSLYSSTQDESYIASTVIDGGGNGSVVRFHNGETNNAKLIGFTIQNGLTGMGELGAGIDISGNNTSPLMDRLIIQNNNSFSGKGGGVHFHSIYGKPILKNSIIKNNTSNSAGGGIAITSSTTDIQNCRIFNNSAPNNGSAISHHIGTSELSESPIINCEIYNNIGPNVIAGTGIVLLNSTIYNNNGSIQTNGNSAIINSIIGNDHSIINQSIMKIYNSIIQGGTNNISTPIPSNITLTLSNIIISNPRFVNATTNNFTLSDYSLGIGGGVASSQFYLNSNNIPIIYNAPIADIDGNSRPNPTGSNPDIGARENNLGTNIHNSTIYVATVGDNSTSVGLQSAPFSTIQAAVNYAFSGDLILVDSGTYNQHDISINKGVTIRSLNGFSNTLIQSNLQWSSIFAITAPSTETVNIEGFKLKSLLTGGGDTEAFQLSNTTVNVSKCWIESFRFATHNGSNITFTNCFFNNNEFVTLQTSAVFNFCNIRNSNIIAGQNLWTVIINNSIIWNNTGQSPNYFVGYAPLLNKVIIDANPNVQDGSTFKQIGNENDLYFTDPANLDFSLRIYSPAVGYGNGFNTPTTDMLGNNRPNPSGSFPDVGAYENEAATMVHNSTIYVATNGNNTGSVGLQSAPFATIQEAVFYAIDGDVILVNSGVYNINNINVNKSITINSINGYAATTLQSSNSRMFTIFGNFSSEIVNVSVSGFKFVALNNATVIGFRAESGAFAKISNCWFEGIYNAIQTYIAFYELNNCMFNNVNALSFNDAGYTDFNQLPKIINCTIINSSSITNSGALIYTKIYNTIIVNSNPSSTSYFNGSLPYLQKVIIDNTPNTQSGSVYNVVNGLADVRFNNASANDFSLAAFSPAIGYGVNISSITNDLSGSTRPMPAGSNSDIGAFENSLATPSNAPPTINSIDSISFVEDAPTQTINLSGITDGDLFSTQPFTINVTSNNLDLIPNPTLTYISNETTGTIQFTPVANASGTASITITIQDEGDTLNGGINTTALTFNVNVAAVNDAPISNSESISSPEDTDLIITLSGTDVENSPLTYTITSLPINGALYQVTNQNNIGTVITNSNTIVSNPNKKVLFRPSPNENGLNYGDFNFKTNDSFVDGNTAQVTINISSVNDIPICTSQNINTLEDTDLIITLSGVDSEGDAMTAKITSLPTNGVLYQTNDGVTKTNPILSINTTVTNSEKKVIFEPLPDESGLNYDNFYFSLSDGIGDGVPSLVMINVTAVNDRPIADAQSVSTDEDTSIAIILNGSDAEGSNLIYRITALPSSGLLYQSTNGVLLGTQITTVPINVSTSNIVIYKPALNQNGSGIGNFQFKSYDGSAYSLLAATVNIDINSVNDAPLATPETLNAIEDNDLSITLSGTDVENDLLTFSIYSLPSNGILYQTTDGVTKTDAITLENTLVTNVNNKVIFEPALNGNGTSYGNFYFKANDGQINGSQSLITLNVTPVNDAPSAVSISGNVVLENLNNQQIGSFSTTDVDSTDTFNYQLISGLGDTDNALFTIVGNQLKNNTSFDYEGQQTYSIRVKSTDSASTFAEEVFLITVGNTNDITINSTVQNTYCNGSNASGTIDITVSQTNGNLSYSWSGPNGFVSTLEDISNVPEGVYTVFVSDANYSKSENITVEANPIYNGLDLCYVTSDATDFTKNRINLSFVAPYNVDKFQILREGTTTGLYDIIGEVNATETSFLDATSVNSATSYKYKVRTKDLCGNTSSESTPHRTILLQSSVATNNSVNLTWTPYEGVSYGTYIVYRKVNNGAFEFHTALSSSNLNYNDINANTETSSYAYYVSIAVNSCTATGKNTSIATEIRSNQKAIINPLVNPTFDIEKSIVIFPNPATETITASMPNELSFEKMEVYNGIGQIIGVYSQSSISIENLASGSYFLKIYTSKGIANKRFVKR
jgi:hypothetical protein